MPEPLDPLPEWWEDAKLGDFRGLDVWLKECGADPWTLSGIPALEELQKAAPRELEKTLIARKEKKRPRLRDLLKAPEELDLKKAPEGKTSCENDSVHVSDALIHQLLLGQQLHRPGLVVVRPFSAAVMDIQFDSPGSSCGTQPGLLLHSTNFSRHPCSLLSLRAASTSVLHGAQYGFLEQQSARSRMQHCKPLYDSRPDFLSAFCLLLAFAFLFAALG